MTFVCWFSNTGKAYAVFFQQLFYLFLISYLNQDTRIFGKQNLNNIFFGNCIQVNFKSAFNIGKAHFQQCGNHTTGRNIVTRKYKSLFDQFLNRVECIAEIFGILNCWNFVTQFIQCLSERRASKFERIEGEVNIIYVCIFIVYQHR